MDIYWYGQSLFKLKGKNATVVVDPYNPEIGLKVPKDLGCNAVLVTHSHPDHNNTEAVSGSPLVVAGPGEYEVAGVTISGTPSFHDNSEGSERGANTIYNISIDGISVVHLGDLGHLLTEEQVSEIGAVDILLVPVGSIYTIDAATAAKVVRQLEPKIVIPMHYKIPDLKADLEPLENFLKEMGAESAQPQPKLTITRDKLPEETQVMVLSKS